MHYIVRLFPEITIKSPPVRKRLTKQVKDNLRKLLVRLDDGIRVARDWEKIDIWVDNESPDLLARVERVLQSTPGVGKYSRVRTYPLISLQEMASPVTELWAGKLKGKTFCVRVKRAGEHDFSSVDVERYLGAELLKLEDAEGVRLKNPDVVVELQIHHSQYHVVEASQNGLGGYPLGSQDAVMSLISGGFDSTVASYLCMKRGLLTHFCFFNLGGKAHELGVKEVASYIWEKYGASHRVKFITVPFEGVVSEILTNVDNAYMGVVLKRMMLRAASAVAAELGVNALVTGESVAQVSSQTLVNLSVIDEATDMLTIRPLSVMDKGEIIGISRAIGTEPFAANMPEYCGVISVRPTTRARRDRVVAEEAQFDLSVLDKAIALRREELINNLLMEDLPADSAVPEILTIPRPGSVIIDIRHPEEIRGRALNAGNARILEIPFFELEKSVPKLDSGCQYLLYCDRGVMSRLHAEILRDKGIENVGVYRPVGT